MESECILFVTLQFCAAKALLRALEPVLLGYYLFLQIIAIRQSNDFIYNSLGTCSFVYYILSIC